MKKRCVFVIALLILMISFGVVIANLPKPSAKISDNYTLTYIEDDNTYSGEVSPMAENPEDVFDVISPLEGVGVVTKYKGNATNIVIPETISGITITELYDSVFKDNTTIQSVTLPDTCTVIGNECFEGCVNLKNIVIQNVTDIGASAFEGCAKLTEVTAPKLRYIWDFAFKGSGLTSFVIPKTTVSMGYGVFAYAPMNNGITVESGNASFVIEDNVLYGADGRVYAYAGDSTIESVTLNPSISINGGPNIDEVAPYAFVGNKNLKSVDLNGPYSKIGCNAFADTNIEMFEACEVWHICEYAFYNCTKLYSFVGDCVSTIEKGAFENSGITEITSASTVFGENRVGLPRLSTIGDNAFKNCTKLISVTFPDNSIESIPNGCFEDCTELDSVDFATLGGTCKSISNTAFKGCILQEIKMSGSEYFHLDKDPNGKYSAIYDKDSLILFASQGGQYVEYTILPRVRVNETDREVVKIQSNAIYGHNFKTFTIPYWENILHTFTIGENAISGGDIETFNYNVKNAKLENGATQGIANTGFAHKFVIGENVTNINTNTFKNINMVGGPQIIFKTKPNLGTDSILLANKGDLELVFDFDFSAVDTNAPMDWLTKLSENTNLLKVNGSGESVIIKLNSELPDLYYEYFPLVRVESDDEYITYTNGITHKITTTMGGKVNGISLNGIEQMPGYDWLNEYIITPDPGHKISKVVINGEEQPLGGNYYYVLTPDLSNWIATIHVEFTREQYTVSLSSSTMGSIVNADTNSYDTSVTLDWGESVTFNFIPRTGCEVKDVKIDGESIGVQTSYTFNNVDANHTLYVEFAIKTFNIILDIDENISVEVEDGKSLTDIRFGDSRVLVLDTTKNLDDYYMFVNNKLVEVKDNKIVINNITQEINVRSVKKEQLGPKEGFNSKTALIIGGSIALLVLIVLVLIIRYKNNKKRANRVLAQGLEQVQNNQISVEGRFAQSQTAENKQSPAKTAKTIQYRTRNVKVKTSTDEPRAKRGLTGIPESLRKRGNEVEKQRQTPKNNKKH